MSTLFTTALCAILSLLFNIVNHPQSKCVVQALLVPVKFDGFVYGNPMIFNPESILIEAFFDPVCPDTRDSWPPLKQALHFYGSKVSLVVHPFPLPYHDNAFVASRALHIVNELNSSATYPLWESFFKDQEKFYSKSTSNMTKNEILDYMVNFVTNSVSHAYHSDVKSGLSDRSTDLKTRISFKYGCSRGVFGTPTFFVNGFPLPEVDSSLEYRGWRKIIDPLIGSKSKHESKN